MSTILDALKKSEQERKLNKVPTLSSLPTPVEPARWPLYLMIGLLLLLLVVGYWLWYNSIELVVEDASDSSNVIVTETNASNNIDNEQASIVVNVLSFSEQSERSFAMINNRLYHQGDFVHPGIKVERITKDTVVLNQRGKLIIKKP